MINFHIISKKGSRPVNEDAVKVYYSDNLFCAALADGLGGHKFGDEASSLVVNTAAECFEKNKNISDECLKQCFETGQMRLMDRQLQQHKRYGMKTTLSVLLSDGQKAIWGHIGDSRIYHFKNGRFLERTHDHSVPELLFLANEITENEIRHHPDRNRLLRVMGTEWKNCPYVLSSVCRLEKDEMFLICSDGFWEYIMEDEMVACLKNAADVKEWIQSMEDLVLQNGASCDMDNYSAIGIWI